ncbi:MAG: hypothetical protein ACLGQH_07395 [Acidobacteriota bacterium]
MNEINFEMTAFPVLSVNNNGKLKVVATCTLTRHNNNWFLLNAAHTLCKDNWGINRPIYIAIPYKNTIELPFALKTTSQTYDNLDIAVTPLRGEFANNFFGLDAWSLSANSPHKLLSGYAERITTFGYPSSRCNIDLAIGEVNANSMTFTSVETNNLSPKTLKRCNIDYDLHIISRYRRRNVKNQESAPQCGFKPQGLSGGPVFKTYVEVGENTDILKSLEFVGISTEYCENQALFKATKISAILDFIKKSFFI